MDKDKDGEQKEVQLQEESSHLSTGTRISPEFKSKPCSGQKNNFENSLALPTVEVRPSKINQSLLKCKPEKRSLSTREYVTKRHRPEEAEQEEVNALSHPSSG